MFITVHTCVYVYSSIWWKAVERTRHGRPKVSHTETRTEPRTPWRKPSPMTHNGWYKHVWTIPKFELYDIGLATSWPDLIQSFQKGLKSMLRRYQYMLFGGARSLMWLLQSFRVCNLLTFHKGPGRPNASCDRPGSGDETGRNSSLRKTHRITLTDPQVSVRKNQCIYDMFGIYSSLKSGSWSYILVYEPK